MLDYLKGSVAIDNATVGDFGADFVNLGTATETVPKPWWVPGLQEFALGAAAFDIGLQIGTTALHFWYEYKMRETVQAGCTNEDYIFAYPPGGYTGPTAGGPGTQTYFMRAYCGGTTVLTGTPSVYSGSGPYNTYYAMTQGLTLGKEYQVKANNCGSRAPDCYVYAVDPKKMFTGEGITASEPPGTNRATSAGFANPSTGAGITTTAPGFGTGSFNPQCIQDGATIGCGSADPNGGPVTPVEGLPSAWVAEGYAVPEANNLRCQLDSLAFACPQASSDGNEWDTTGGPLIVMPDCYGMAVDACENAINSQLTAAGSDTSAAFSITEAPTYDPSLPDGVVQATVAAANALADASDVTIELNESSASGECKSDTHYPHASTYANFLEVGVKARVWCPTDQSVTFTIQLFKCASPPEANIAELTSGSWGCVSIGNEPSTFTIAVPAAGWSLDEGVFGSGPADPASWYIGYTAGPNLQESYSQRIPGSVMRQP